MLYIPLIIPTINAAIPRQSSTGNLRISLIVIHKNLNTIMLSTSSYNQVFFVENPRFLNPVYLLHLFPQHRLYFFPLPQIHGSFGYIFFFLFYIKNCSVLRSMISFPYSCNCILLLSGISVWQYNLY